MALTAWTRSIQFTKTPPVDGEARRDKMPTPHGGTGKITHSDEEIRRWRQLGATMSAAHLHRMLAAEGKIVALNYVGSVLRGDARPFA